ncbi:MAG: IS66 family transposase [Gemmatimonadetes bacterium]|nr:IS66 family transposase [Gemmatimonadota bacterium]
MDTAHGGQDLQAEIERLRTANEELAARLRELEKEKAQLALQLEQLKKLIYGRSSERYTDHPDLPFEAEEPPKPPHVGEAPDEEYEVVRKKPRKRGIKRLREDLPRDRIVIEIPEDERRCACGGVMESIGEEVTEELEYQPASFFIREIVRKKYACKKHEEQGVLTPDLPARPIAKGMPGPGLIAQVLTAKYKDHLPLHRQHGIYRRHGVDIAESTLCDWVADGARIFKPVVECLKNAVLESHVVQTDDTPITIQDRTIGRGSRRGYLWVYLGDQGDAVFDYTSGRSRDGPKQFLGDYKGWLQADAYSGYDAIFRDGSVVEVGCWAHARRRFFKALSTDPEDAGHILASIRHLYRTERDANQHQFDHAARRELRNQQAGPVLNALRPWLESLQRAVLPKSPFGKAISYCLNQWQALNRFLEDGALKLDNNRSELALRQVAVGRKNWLFAGSDSGAKRAATIYSIVVTCWLNKIDPFAYMRDVMPKLAAGPSCADDLTPRAWRSSQRS